MTAEEFLKDKGWYAGSLMLSKTKGQGLVSITEAMEEYNQHKLKLLGIVDVVGRGEQLNDFMDYCNNIHPVWAEEFRAWIDDYTEGV